jgi:glycosyltransferase involved in cell wall biosynthesis
MLRRMLAPAFDRMTVVAPTMDPADFERDRGHLGRIDETREGIRWVALYPIGAPTALFWLRHALPALFRIVREVRRADLVHSGHSNNLFRPVEFPALVLARLLGKTTVCVVDIDLRNQARMQYRIGQWSKKSYLLARCVYDPLRHLQLRHLAPRCSLVLFKGRAQCRDYGRGRGQVKYFLDAAFSAEHLIPEAELDRKIDGLADPARPLELVYFGRLIACKGIDRCLEALAQARQRTSAPVRFSIIGDGEEGERLRRLATERGLDGVVRFEPAVPFGPRLFAALYPLHVLLGAALIEDTPRSVLDAMACGIPSLAFASAYLSDLATSGAVDLVPWLGVGELADRIVHYAEDKTRLAPLMRAAREFATSNTQEQWLQRRAGWTRELLTAKREVAARPL